MPDHPPQKIRRILRVATYNIFFALAGLALIALAGEVYLRLTKPSTTPFLPTSFVPKVGLILTPNAEVRWTIHMDFWTVSRTNSLGFLDREPVSGERAASSCHIAMIGDSMVEAREVPIADKFHVRLEELAARHLPHLDITTSAYGQSGTGQINQLPYYDAFARHLSPKLVVLVFVINDFYNNSPIMSSVAWKILPDRQPYVTATRDENGAIKLRPPYPDWRMFRFPQLPKSHYVRIVEYLESRSYFVQGLKNNLTSSLSPDRYRWTNWPELQSRYPGYESLLEELRPTSLWDLDQLYDKKTLSPFLENELAFTAFALDQFAERAERDGASLVILATHAMGSRGHAFFNHMNALAEARGIPVISQYDYICRQGGEMRDARWARDGHWNAQGHQWAAEALLEYLEKNPEVCNGPVPREMP